MGSEDPVFVSKVFDVVDQDRSGLIDWQEFIQAMSLLEKCSSKDRLMFLFRVMNDGATHVSLEDAKRTFKATITSAEEDVAEQLAESFTKFLPKEDHQGRISFNDVMLYLDTLPDDFSPYQYLAHAENLAPRQTVRGSIAALRAEQAGRGSGRHSVVAK